MTFASFSFALFFPIVAVAYYLCPARFRWALLLVASCYFYMAFIPAYILILFALIIVDFCMALLIERSSGARRTHFLWVSIFSTVAILFVFKYFNFFNANLSTLAHLLHWNYGIGALSLILPLGLSFHTFQSLSYVIEVYRGTYKAERHFGIYALYVMFFPQLIAGPIERPYHLLPQLKARIPLNWYNVLSGLRLMAWGFFKKLVIADRLALSVDYVWGNVAHVPGLSILFAIIFFAFQLYADFSGYSDIARGSARVLGIDVVRNFEQPYFSASIAEFWRRWHISLSGWFRDYFFTPIALPLSRRFSRTGLYLATFLTFLVLGFWHGAAWTFIIMGALHGSYLVLGMLTKKWRDAFVRWSKLSTVPRLHHTLQVLYVFVLAAFSWIFFRAPGFGAALAFIKHLFTGWSLAPAALIHQYFFFPFDTLGFSQSDLLISLGGILFLLLVERAEERQPLSLWFERRPIVLRAFAYTGIVLMIAVFGVFVTKQFIYFQF